MIEKPIGTPYESGDPTTCPGVRLWNRWGVLDAADVCLDALERSGLQRLQMRYLNCKRRLISSLDALRQQRFERLDTVCHRQTCKHVQ